MTRRMLALALTTLLSRGCFGQTQASGPPSAQEQVRAIAANSPVEVKYLDNSKQRGWIGEVSDTGFVLSHEQNKQMEKSQVTFTQVKTVKQLNDIHGHKRRNIAIAVGVGVAVAVSIAVVYALALSKLANKL